MAKKKGNNIRSVGFLFVNWFRDKDQGLFMRMSLSIFEQLKIFDCSGKTTWQEG
jgi:hypothetical protein